ncbi:MAG: TauD/TfdA family dioxygenase, partial [Rhodospirillaceae bacterium]
ESVEGMDYKEGRQFIDDLNARMIRPEWVYAHSYRDGDVVMWDNRRMLHKATPYDTAKERRVMRRTTIVGEAPVA